MKYLNFDKSQLVNLEYSTSREFIRTNRSGSYASSSIIGCNTRKYHGLLVSPVSSLGDERFVFLSSLDETVIQHDAEFNLAIHKYGPETYCPKGHKYVVDYDIEYIPKITFRVGGVLLTKEFIMIDERDQIMVKYTLCDAHSPTRLRLRPMLANRGIHELAHANIYANSKVTFIPNGISSQM
ncbi:MAG: glycogen debranching enzyme N-terminal domain-containing protein, partial [Bacteroidales bacterium]